MRLGTNWSSSVPRSASAIGVETLDLGGVPGADGLVEAAGGLRLELRRLGRGDVPLGRRPRVGTGVVGHAAAHHQSGGLLTRCRAPAGRRAPAPGPAPTAGTGRGVVTTDRLAGRRSSSGSRRSSLRGEPGELVRVDPQLRPHAQGLRRDSARTREAAATSSKARCAAVDGPLAGRLRQPGSPSVASMRASPERSSSGSRTTGALRCPQVLDHGLAVAPRQRPRGRARCTRSRSRSRCVRAVVDRRGRRA